MFHYLISYIASFANGQTGTGQTCVALEHPLTTLDRIGQVMDELSRRTGVARCNIAIINIYFLEEEGAKE